MRTRPATASPRPPFRWLPLPLALAALGCSPTALAADSQEAVELQTVQVEAQAQEGTAASGYRSSTASTGPLGRMSLQDTPYSLNVTSGELFANRHAHTVSEALKTNPTVSTLMESSGYSSMSRVMVRGFTAADQSDLRDGLVDRSFTYVPLENVERIEVLNGLSGFLYGFSALGGSINYVSKQPTAAPFVSLTAGQYGGGLNYLHADAGGPLPLDERWTYRLNAYHEDGSTYVEGSHQERSLFSAAVNFRLSAATRLSADIWHQDLEMNGLQTYLNVNPGGGIHVPDASRFDATTQYGQDWSYNKSKKTLMGLGLETALNDTFTFRTAYRFGDMWRDYQYVAGSLTDNAGQYTETAWGSTRQTEQTHSGYALMDADFQTGSVGHKLTFGYTGTSYLYTRGNDVKSALGLSDIDAPAWYADPGLDIGGTNVWYQQHYRNWVLGDRIEFSPRWSALVGLNRASLDLRRWGSGTALSAKDYAQHETTPSLALMFKPQPNLTTYVSYMEGLANGGTAPTAAKNAGEMLAPSVSKQYELGVKASLGRMDLTAALFRIDKVNEFTDPADNTYKQDGREVHQGLEFTASGKLTERLTLVGGFTVLSAEVTEARNNPDLEGKTPVNVPERQARLYLEYALAEVPGLNLTGGANYFGKRPVDAMNTEYLAGATTFDLGARYQTRVAGRPLTLNLGVSNLFDKAYWSYYRSGDGLLLGAPRVVSFSARTEW